MSRIHDALRRAEQSGPPQTESTQAPADGTPSSPSSETEAAQAIEGLLAEVEEIPFNPAPEALLIDTARPQDSPSEEFRSLRTRLNHLQTLQPIHTLVVTSPSPAEGKSFVATNLALAQAHLSGNNVLLADFDFRRPILHTLFRMERTPGAIDYLLGNVPLSAAIKKIAGTNLYVMPAGSTVKNPLEILNLREVRNLLEWLPTVFNWVIMDTPPLLFSADANLMTTMSDGALLVVRIGNTTFDSVTRAIQSLCENNVVGIVANCARAGELYSKYAYYYSRYYSHREEQ